MVENCLSSVFVFETFFSLLPFPVLLQRFWTSVPNLKVRICRFRRDPELPRPRPDPFPTSCSRPFFCTALLFDVQTVSAVKLLSKLNFWNVNCFQKPFRPPKFATVLFQLVWAEVLRQFTSIPSSVQACWVNLNKIAISNIFPNFGFLSQKIAEIFCVRRKTRHVLQKISTWMLWLSSL